MADNSAQKPSGVNGGIRIVLALLVGIALGIFMLAWDSNFIKHDAFPDWLGPYIIMPVIAICGGYGSTCLIQQLSCGQVQWWVQFQRVLISPIPIVLMWFILGIAPGLRWPIEGLIQSGPPSLQRGLSSGFYAFWVGLYFQNMLNGAAQICPK
jgi:hypothetical protein